MYTRRESLALARQIRTCPPARVKNDPRFKKEVQRHIATCPFCTAGVNDELEAWQALAGEIKQKMGAYEIDPAPAPGQIRALDTGLSCFREDDFYNPPTVMVLKLVGTADNAVTVAQVYEDLAMAGPGDLIPPEHMSGGMTEIFIEPWNIYTLDRKFLGPCLGTLTPEVVGAVIEMDENPDRPPDWAIRAMPMKEEDARLYFRELEIETGFTFASMAADKLMAEMEQVSVPMGIKDLMTAIKTKIPGVTWDWVPESIEECMAAICFPSHALPMAAAQQEGETITANYFSFTNEGLGQIKQVQCRIDYATKPPAPYSVSGLIDALPPDIPETAFQCYIKDEKNKLLLSCNFILETTGRFMAVFDRPLGAHERPVLFIVHQEDGY